MSPGVSNRVLAISQFVGERREQTMCDRPVRPVDVERPVREFVHRLQSLVDAPNDVVLARELGITAASNEPIGVAHRDREPLRERRPTIHRRLEPLDLQRAAGLRLPPAPFDDRVQEIEAPGASKERQRRLPVLEGEVVGTFERQEPSPRQVGSASAEVAIRTRT